MKTILYLIRPGGAEELEDAPLDANGLRQAELTRDFLAIRPIDCCYASPARRALETAAVIAVPHGVHPVTLVELGACGEPSQLVFERISQRHLGQGCLIVAHPIVQRLYLADLLCLPPEQADQVNLDPCGISVVTRAADKTIVHTLNAAFHLQGAAA